MARNAVDSFVKRNNKLEAFLKKNLDEDTFERIRAHEACVVCSRKEDKAFKFLILSDDWVYLTENPPKKVTEEVHLGNIVSIKLVNDFPDFLSGQERENTQHIVIKHMAREPPKGKLKKQQSREEHAASNANGNLTYRGSLSARSQSTWGDRKTQSLKETPTKRTDIPAGSVRRRCSVDADLLRDITDQEDSKNTKQSKKKNKKQKQNGDSGDNLTDSQNKKGGRQLPAVRRALPSLDENQSPAVNKKLHHTHSGELRLALDKLDENEDGMGTTREQLTSRRSARSNNNNTVNLSKSDSEVSLRNSDSQSVLSMSSSEGKKSRKSSSVKWAPILEEDENEYFLKALENIEEEENKEDESWYPEELHIYILNLSSPVLMYSRAAWQNYLIRETLEQDPEYYERTVGFLEPKLSASEKFSLLFNQLKIELMQDDVTIEEMFSLVNELKAGAERNFALKKLFWRTPDMFLFFIQKLKAFLPNSPTKMFAESEDDKSQRADELEFVILVLETLALMFRETEILPSRLSCLRSGQGRAAQDLVELLLVQPQLFDVDRPKAEFNLMEGKKENLQPNWATEADEELLILAEELNVAATVILSELILIAIQTNWGDDSADNFLHLSWLVNIVDAQTSTEDFLEQVVMRALQLISPMNKAKLAPSEAVTLFYQFSVLQTMMEYSSKCNGFIKENFFEEFKYFVQGPVILSKLPQHFPIAETTVRLIEKVMSNILGKSVSLSLNNALK